MAKPYSEIEHRDGKLYWTSGNRRGQEAGTLRKDGYLTLDYQGKKWLAHRLIWKLVHGEVPPLLDHINEDRSDNRIENLRPCTKKQNAANYTKKTGFRGVSKRYRASIYSDGKSIHIGMFTNKEEAAMAYNIEAEKLFGKFAKFNKVFEDHPDAEKEFVV